MIAYWNLDFIEADYNWRFIASIVASFDNLDSNDLLYYTGTTAAAFVTFCDFHGAKYRSSLSACRRGGNFELVTAIGEPISGVTASEYIREGWGIGNETGLVFYHDLPERLPTGTPVFRASEVFFCSGNFNRSGSDPNGSINGMTFCWKPAKDEVFKYNAIAGLWTESCMAHLVALHGVGFGDVTNNWFAGVYSPNIDYFYGGDFSPAVAHATELTTDSVQERHLVYANNRRVICEGFYYGWLPAAG